MCARQGSQVYATERRGSSIDWEQERQGKSCWAIVPKWQSKLGRFHITWWELHSTTYLWHPSSWYGLLYQVVSDVTSFPSVPQSIMLGWAMKTVGSLRDFFIDRSIQVLVSTVTLTWAVNSPAKCRATHRYRTQQTIQFMRLRSVWTLTLALSISNWADSLFFSSRYCPTLMPKARCVQQSPLPQMWDGGFQRSLSHIVPRLVFHPCYTACASLVHSAPGVVDSGGS